MRQIFCAQLSHVHYSWHWPYSADLAAAEIFNYQEKKSKYFLFLLSHLYYFPPPIDVYVAAGMDLLTASTDASNEYILVMTNGFHIKQFRNNLESDLSTKTRL